MDLVIMTKMRQIRITLTIDGGEPSNKLNSVEERFVLLMISVHEPESVTPNTKMTVVPLRNTTWSQGMVMEQASRAIRTNLGVMRKAAAAAVAAALAVQPDFLVLSAAALSVTAPLAGQPPQLLLWRASSALVHRRRLVPGQQPQQLQSQRPQVTQGQSAVTQVVPQQLLLNLQLLLLGRRTQLATPHTSVQDALLIPQNRLGSSLPMAFLCRALPEMVIRAIEVMSGGAGRRVAHGMRRRMTRMHLQRRRHRLLLGLQTLAAQSTTLE